MLQITLKIMKKEFLKEFWSTPFGDRDDFGVKLYQFLLCGLIFIKKNFQWGHYVQTKRCNYLLHLISLLVLCKSYASVQPPHTIRILFLQSASQWSH